MYILLQRLTVLPTKSFDGSKIDILPYALAIWGLLLNVELLLVIIFWKYTIRHVLLEITVCF